MSQRVKASVIADEAAENALGEQDDLFLQNSFCGFCAFLSIPRFVFNFSPGKFFRPTSTAARLKARYQSRSRNSLRAFFNSRFPFGCIINSFFAVASSLHIGSGLPLNR
jgi:hypothetical protein